MTNFGTSSIKTKEFVVIFANILVHSNFVEFYTLKMLNNQLLWCQTNCLE